jgi:hypothetical protein
MTTFSVPIGELELAEVVQAWFSEAMKRRWTSPVGRVIKGELVKSGRWRNAKRGDPRAGYLAMRGKVG